MRVIYKIGHLGKSLFAAALTVSIGVSAQAQEFPSKPLTLVVPYPPGGTTDALARVMQEPMTRFLGQPVIVENKPGGGAVLGTKLVANAPADGYTMLFPNNGLVISPQVNKAANYDPLKDFAAVSLVSLQPLILMTNPSVPASNMKEFVDYAKASPKKLNYASAGPGSFGHLATELLSQRAGIEMVHVPYKGLAPTTQALVANEVQILLSTTSGQMNAFVKEGRARMLGVSSTTPSLLAPGAEPIAESLPGFEALVWFGLLVPAGTPQDAIAKLNDAVVKTLALPEVRERFHAAGSEATSSTPEEFGRRVKDEFGMWTDVIRDARIKVN